MSTGLERTEEDATSIAMLCRIAAMAHEPCDRLKFLELVIADLTEARDEAVHQASSLHHLHNQL